MRYKIIFLVTFAFLIGLIAGYYIFGNVYTHNKYSNVLKNLHQKYIAEIVFEDNSMYIKWLDNPFGLDSGELKLMKKEMIWSYISQHSSVNFLVREANEDGMAVYYTYLTLNNNRILTDSGEFKINLN